MTQIVESEKERMRNQFIDERSDNNGPKSASKGVSNESSKERSEARSSIKVGERD